MSAITKVGAGSLVAHGTRTVAPGGGNWSSAATWVEGAVPTAADDVVLNASSGQLTINAAAACRSFDCTGYTGTLTHAAGITLSIGDGSDGPSTVALKLVAGMTYTLGNGQTSAVDFVRSPPHTPQTVDFAGKTVASLSFGSGSGSGECGNWKLTGGFTTASNQPSVSHIRGTLDINGQTITTGSFGSSSGNTRTLLLGAASITCLAGVTFAAAGLTFDAGTSLFTQPSTNSSFTTGGLTFYDLTQTGAGQGSVNGGGSFRNYSRIGTATQTNQFILNGSFTVTGLLTLTGNSIANTLLAASSAELTAMTITAAAVSLTNVDFRDIAGAGAASPFAGTRLGDCLGNSGITFTITTQTFAGGNKNYSDPTAWTSRVPLPQDLVVVNTAAGGLTQDMARVGNINCTGFTGTFSWAVNCECYAALTWGVGMTMSGSVNVTLRGRSALSLTNNGVVWSTSLQSQARGGVYTLADDMTFISTKGLSAFQIGTLDANGHNVDAGFYQFTGATVNMGSGTWTVRAAFAAAWNVTAGVVNCQTSTILFAASATNRTFGGSQTYNVLDYTAAGSTGSLTITGSNTFAELRFSDATNARTLTLTAGTTQTVTTFTVNGTAGKLMTINSSSNGSPATISKASGTVNSDYLSVKDSAAIGGATWHAGANSTSVSGNSGWLFP